MKIKFSVVSLIIFVFISELASAATLTGSESFTGSEPTMVPRFFRSGTPGDACSTFSSGNFQYQTIPFKTDNTGQLDVTFDPGTLGTGVFVTFHTAPFDPTNICDRYVWSYGSSQAFSNQQFSVTPNTDMVMIVSGVQNSPGVVGGPYTYTIAGASISPTIPTNVQATAGIQSAIVSFTPSTGTGGTITYEATCDSSNGGVTGSASGTASPITVTGLTAARSYTCTVTATDTNGTSEPSDPTNAVIPTALPNPIPTLSEWAQILMMLSMIGIAAWSYRRKLR